MTKHSPIIAGDFYADTETKLLAARRDSDLSGCAALLDSFEFQQLPEHRQVHLCTLYSEAFFRITGAFIA